MNRNIGIISFFFMLLSILSCDYFRKEEVNPDVVARVYESYLYKEDIRKILPSDYTFEDSVKIANSFVNNWALKKILMHKAKENISDNQEQQFETLIEQYRTDLYTQSYMEILANKELDTVVTNQEAEDFYLNNKNIFVLNEDLLKLRYVKLNEKDAYNEDIISKFKRFNKEDKNELNSLSLHIVSSFFNDSVWVKASEVYDRLPFLKEKLEGRFSEKNLIEQKDSTGIYWVKVNHFLRKNTQAPIEYIEPTLRQIILNRRKSEQIKTLEDDIINKAIKKKQFEIYE